MLKIKKPFHENKKIDILIFGSSHAQFGVSPKIISDETDLSCLNIAYGDGANMGKQLNLLKQILKKGDEIDPQIILFGMDVFTLNSTPVYNDQFQDILFEKSNLGKSNFFKSYIILYHRFIPRYLKDIMNKKYTLPYFRKDTKYDLTMFKKFENYQIDQYGWVMGSGILNENYIRYDKIIFNPNKKAIKDLDEFIDICKKKNIQLLFFQTPEHKVSLNFSTKYKKFDDFMEQLSKNKSVKYLNYNHSKEFPTDNDLYFFDSDHLNKEGAILFTKELSKDIIK
jgi:hypothetical protein